MAKKNCPGYTTGKQNLKFCFGMDGPVSALARRPNLVGCAQMELFICPMYGGVYTYGKWINLRGDFLYDRKYMEYLIKKSVKEFPDCPYLNTKWAISFVGQWPYIINPNIDERVTIWPPVIGRFESELLEIGLSMQGPPVTPNGEEYPIFTDTSFFLEIINRAYGENITSSLKKVLLKTYEEICLQAIQLFD